MFHFKNRTLLRGSTCLSALLISGSVFAVGEGPTIVERWVSESKSVSFFDLSYQTLSYDEGTDVTEVTGLKVTFSPNFSELMADEKEAPKIEYTFTAPTMRYTALSEDSSYYSASKIEAPEVDFDFSIAGAAEELELNGLDSQGKYEGLTVSDAIWAKLPDIVDDPQKPISKYYPMVAALMDSGFLSMEIKGAKTQQPLDEATDMDVVYGPMKFGEVIKGDYSTLILDGLTMTSVPNETSDQEDKDVGFNVTIGTIEASDYNGGTMIRQFDPALSQSDRDTPFKTMVGKISALDINVKMDDTFSAKLDEISYTDWGVRAPSLPLLEMADAMYLKAQETDEDPDEKEVIKMVASLYAMFRIGSFDMNGFDLDVDDDGEQVQASLDSFRIADLWSAGMGEFSIKGFKMQGDGNSLRSDTFQILDVGFPTLEALMDAERASEEMDIAGIIAALPTLGLIEVAGIDFNLKDEADLKLDLSRLEMGNFIGRLPTKISTNLENLQLDVSDLDQDARSAFEKLGYERINISYALSLLWDEASEMLSASTNSSLQNGGDVNADLEIGGVPRSVFENPETAQNALAFLTFNAASVVFNDSSIVDRALQSVAKEQDKDVDQLKQELLGALPFVMSVLNKPDFVDDVSAALTKLLDDSGSIVATAKPDQPVSVMQVIAGGATAPGALVDLLQVEVTAE